MSEPRLTGQENGKAMIWNSDNGIDWRFEEVKERAFQGGEAYCGLELLMCLGKYPDILKKLGFLD